MKVYAQAHVYYLQPRNFTKGLAISKTTMLDTPPPKIKFANYAIAAVLDDHKLYANAFATLLEKMNLFHAVYVFTREEDLMQYLINRRDGVPIYLFTDYHQSEKMLIPLINELRRLYRSLIIIIVSSITNPILINHILSHNVNGILSKASETDEIIDCIHHINKKDKYISPHILDIIKQHSTESPLPFTNREIEILSCFAKGLSVNATAEKMMLSRHTIVAHRRKMMAKVNSHTITELLAYARKIDLI